jgi:lysophospholipase L1-like esterase
MKLKLILLVFIALSAELRGQESYTVPEDVSRIVFLGNSITYKGLYVTYLETWLTLTYPERNIEFMNVGLPSETVSGLSEPGHAKGAYPRPVLRERLDRVLEQTNPDLVFACYGMNDGVYLPFDDARFRKYREGIEWLHAEVMASGAEIVFLTPPVYDPRKGAAYSNVLDIYSAWLISKRYTDQWKVADLHGPMRTFLEEQREADPSFYLARDGVHPGETGHWLMAREILHFMGHQEVKDIGTIQGALAPFPYGQEVLELIDRRQRIMKDAWLTSTGHTRPRMKEGMSMEDAEASCQEIRQTIDTLLERN